MAAIDWCAAVRSTEPQWIEAIKAADETLSPVLRAKMTRSLVKQSLSHFIRRELLGCGLDVVRTSSGNADVDYFVWRGTAVIRVKGLNRNGLPSNYPTDTAVNYHLGNEVDNLPDLPPLPRVDVSYRLDEELFTFKVIELLEWREGIAMRRYQLPMWGMPREVEVAEELRFPVMPTIVRPRRDEIDRRRADKERGEQA